MRLGKRLKGILGVVLMATMLVGCASNASGNSSDEGNNGNKNDEEVVLNLWSHYGGFEDLIEGFQKEYPNIKVNVETFKYEDYEVAYKESLAMDKGEADLFVIDSNHFGNFNSINALEDLLKPEYNIAEYEEGFDKELWELGKSLDKKELVGLPIATAPIVTYYRADILEKYRFPSDPDELAKFMENEENWFNMAKTLSEDGYYAVQWPAELVRIMTSNMPYFDENLEYQRDNEEFERAISIALKAESMDIPADTDIWADKGSQYLKEGKFAMLYLGSWGANDLASVVGDQAGKWRVTSLPFGAHGWNNASIMSIAKNSEKKDAAWKFIEYSAFKYNDPNKVGSVPGYLPLRENYTKDITNPFLGGQYEQEVYRKTLAETEEYEVSPFDTAAFEIWDYEVRRGIDESLTAEQVRKNINESIDKKLGNEIEALKKKLERDN
ncbi:MAG: ABC transporter substrate-binding protein [Clostridium sp.]